MSELLPTSLDSPIFRCICKGIIGETDAFRYSPAWVTARRARLEVFGDHLKCGDWVIPYSTISEAVLFETRQMFIPGFVLKLRTDSHAYHFGLLGNRFWRGNLPFPVTRTKGRLRYSAFSIAMRVALLILVIWVIWGSLLSGEG